MLKIKIEVMCFSETDKIKKYTDNYVILSGVFREIVYLYP